jgi:hypothetical protein
MRLYCTFLAEQIETRYPALDALAAEFGLTPS